MAPLVAGKLSGNRSYPSAKIIVGPDGLFYGSTLEGGRYGLGTMFKMSSSGTLTTIHHFSGSDGKWPGSPLASNADGFLYRTTGHGGAFGDYGTVFKMDIAGNVTTLHSFNNTDGAYPEHDSPLALGSDGNYYGTTGYGGTTNRGVAFRISTAGAFTVIHSFAGADGVECTPKMRH